MGSLCFSGEEGRRDGERRRWREGEGGGEGREGGKREGEGRERGEPHDIALL